MSKNDDKNNEETEQTFYDELGLIILEEPNELSKLEQIRTILNSITEIKDNDEQMSAAIKMRKIVDELK